MITDQLRHIYLDLDIVKNIKLNVSKLIQDQLFRLINQNSYGEYG
jgi:hypothetical protein